MAEKFEKLIKVILRTWRKEATENDNRSLQQWLDSSGENRQWLDQFDNEKFVATELEHFGNINVEAGKQRFWNKLAEHKKQQTEKWGEIFFYAAAVFLLLLSEVYLHFVDSNDQKTSSMVATPKDTDVRPGENRALLELANGDKITIRPNDSGEIANDGLIRFVKNGPLIEARQLQSNIRKAPAYNSMKIPRGGQFELMLPDGSKVWLNSATSIRFPSVFTGPVRNVMLSGEAYFEVKDDIDHPFEVMFNGIQIQVLGTKFNINSYPDEGKTITTLVSGKLKIKYDSIERSLDSNQTALIVKGQGIQIVETDNMEEILAWKNGSFRFTNDSTTSILRQLSRWYDLDIKYIDTPTSVNSYWASRSFGIDRVLKELMNLDSTISMERNGKLVSVKTVPLH